MGFDSESAGQPLVNVHKKTTKVNLFMSVGVAIFFLVAIGYILYVAHRDERGEPVKPAAAQKK